MANTLAERLKTRASRFDTSDYAWFRFLQDHRAYLVETSTEVPLTNDGVHLMDYRPLNILSTLNLDHKALSCIYMLNGIKSFIDVRGLTSLIVPDLTRLNELRTTYNSLQA